MAMNKVKRARQAMEAELLKHAGPFFNTVGNPNSVQQILLNAGYEKFSTTVIALAWNSGGAAPVQAVRDIDPHGTSIRPKAAYSITSGTNKYDDSNLRYDMKGNVTHAVKTWENKVKPAIAAGHTAISNAKAALLEKYARTGWALMHMDDVPALVQKIKSSQEAAQVILSELADAGIDPDIALQELGLSAAEAAAIFGSSLNDEVAVGS